MIKETTRIESKVDICRVNTKVTEVRPVDWRDWRLNGERTPSSFPSLLVVFHSLLLISSLPVPSVGVRVAPSSRDDGHITLLRSA